MNNILIQFQGFHPSDFTRAFWDAQLSQLSAIAPQGATIRAGLMRKGRLFSANVRILSRRARKCAMSVTGLKCACANSLSAGGIYEFRSALEKR